ncbi:uncharacterized protein LOC122037041 [Zingiber officinale]|uniref:uncharacterized protein LOC122037041 n=1 Tax=Zingiber officinale TaxID=94328 RepID=UPI001C4DAD86|nr:uncharacterized protein LOC122037041 [Zingiber officinale]
MFLSLFFAFYIDEATCLFYARLITFIEMLVQISGGTPIKMLLLEECRSKKPSVVARLMGLDSIPARGKVRDDDNYLMNGLKAAFQQLQQQQQASEVEQQLKNARVLNSNTDLFLEFLEQPNSLFSKHLFQPQTTRITVLKPSITKRPTSIVVLKPTGDLASDQLITCRDINNGYIADDEVGSASDSELATSTSISREAKRKLSERLAFGSSDINFLERRYLRASGSTLGELLGVCEGSNEEHRKLSLKDKVSSFFFSRRKRTNAYSFPMFPEEGDHQDKCSSVTIAGRPESVSRSRPIESVARSAAATKGSFGRSLRAAALGWWRAR